MDGESGGCDWMMNFLTRDLWTDVEVSGLCMICYALVQKKCIYIYT